MNPFVESTEAERQYHEVANIFPLMQPDEYEGLKEDIRANGLLEPVWLHPEDKSIVDGRNRHRACVELGIAPKFRYWDGKGSLVSFVVSLNLNRRHLDVGQRACVALEILPMLEKEAKERQSHGQTAPGKTLVAELPQASDRGKSREKAAELAKVGGRSVQKAKSLKNEAPDLFSKVASGKKKLEEATRELKGRKKEEKRQEVLDKYDKVDDWDGDLKVNTISLADIHTLQLPSESVDMVFTDPPYHDEYIDLYEQLARVAEVALKPGGYLMAYAGKMFIPEVMKHLSSRLEYVSIYAVFQPFSQARITKHNVFENWRPILVFKKPGKTETKEWAQDVVRGTRDKSHHEWQQDTEAPLQYIAAYTKPGDIVLDPFVGGGTTPWSCKQLGRYYVCFDTDESAVKLATERVKNE